MSNVTPAPGDPERASECCLAPVEQKLQTVTSPTKATWQSSWFVCTRCGKQCAVYADARLLAMLRKTRGVT